MMIANVIKNESDILFERLEKDLVAVGEFSAQDLIMHSVNEDDFNNGDDCEV